MEEKKRSVLANGVIFGSITGVVLIIFSLILFLADLYMNKALGWVSYLLMIGGMIYGTLEYRKKYLNGFMSYGQSFLSCFFIAITAMIISTIYFYVFTHFIHPGYMQEINDLMRTSILEKNPNMSEDDLEKAIKVAKMFMSPGLMFIFGIVINSIISLIVAIFLKKEDPAQAVNN